MDYIYLSDNEAPAYELEHAQACAERLHRVPVLSLDYVPFAQRVEQHSGGRWLLIIVACLTSAALVALTAQYLVEISA